MPARYALIDSSDLLASEDATAMCKALEQSASDIWLAWRHLLDPAFADAAPQVFQWQDWSALPDFRDPDPLLKSFIPITMGERNGPKGTLAIHSRGTRPWCEVFVHRATGTFSGHNSAFEAADHELHESLVNPFLRRFVPHPRRTGWKLPLETDDPSQQHYAVDVDGVSYPFSNFVLPAYFGLDNHPDYPEDQLDHWGELSAPFEIGRAGYHILIRGDWEEVDYEFGSEKPGFSRAEMASMSRPLSRVGRIARGERCDGDGGEEADTVPPPAPPPPRWRLSERDYRRLEGVHQDLLAVTILASLKSDVEFHITRTGGKRSAKLQRQLVARGASSKESGPDGRYPSRHLTGHAVDIYAVEGGKPSWSLPLILKVHEAFAEAAHELGVVLRWGGDWNENGKTERGERDRVHHELPRHTYGNSMQASQAALAFLQSVDIV